MYINGNEVWNLGNNKNIMNILHSGRGHVKGIVYRGHVAHGVSSHCLGTLTREPRCVKYPRVDRHQLNDIVYGTRRSSVSTHALAEVLSTSPFVSDIAATVMTFVAGVLAVSSIKWLENNGVLHKVCDDVVLGRADD